MGKWQMPGVFPDFKTHVKADGSVFVQCKRCWFFDSQQVEVRHPKQNFATATAAASWMREHQHGQTFDQANSEMNDFLAARDAEGCAYCSATVSRVEARMNLAQTEIVSINIPCGHVRPGQAISGAVFTDV